MSAVTLARNTNQARGLGDFALEFIASGEPSASVRQRTAEFHTDSVLCGLSALALGTNAPTVLRTEALDYPDATGATVFGSPARIKPEKAIVANAAAVREWDSNGTNFGYRPELGHTAGEFGHNDFYSVAIAGCQVQGLPGAAALRAMILIDEIRGRLAEVFSLKSYKIDHVLHGAIASAAAYGALRGASAEQIESAIGMTVAHYTPWRAIRAGKQLSDSKGASAALSTEMAITSVHRSMRGFRGPQDIFRNPEAIFRFFEPTTTGAERWKEHGDSPFDLVLSTSGDDFAVMGMHFKLGIYEHQSAGALQAIIDLIQANPTLLAERDGRNIRTITIQAYEPAFGIIGNPMKKDPKTRQSADHSMAFIVSALLKRALETPNLPGTSDELWKALMLDPYDYEVSSEAIFHPLIRSLMDKIEFQHGGSEFDSKYPEGIPTSVQIEDANGAVYDSGLIMFPAGHARNTTADRAGILAAKFKRFAQLAVESDAEPLLERLAALESLDPAQLLDLYDVELANRPYQD